MRIPLMALLLCTLGFADAVVGQAAPALSVKDASGKARSLSEFKGKFVVVEWYNQVCPFVKKHYQGNMQELQKTWRARGVTWLTIDSTAAGKSGYLETEAAEALVGKTIHADAFLLDREGTVGRAWGAKATPHLFIVDPKGVVAYAGAIDDRPSAKAEDIPGALNYVSVNLEALLAGKPAPHPQTKQYGCGVKYASK